MKTKFYLPFALIIAMTLSFLVSCFYDPYMPICFAYIQSEDTLSVDYPDDIYDKARAYKNTYENIRVVKDTTFSTFHRVFYDGYNTDNIQLQVTRETMHKEVKIMYLIAKLLPLNLYDVKPNEQVHPVNQHALDSLMDIYGVTMPATQDVMTVPLTVNPK